MIFTKKIDTDRLFADICLVLLNQSITFCQKNLL